MLPWTEQYVVTLNCTEPAPPCNSIEGCSPLHTCPIDGMLDIVTLEGLYMCAECGGSIGIIINLSHVSLVSLLKPNSTTSVWLSWIIKKKTCWFFGLFSSFGTKKIFENFSPWKFLKIYGQIFMIVGFLGWIFLLCTLFTPKFNSETQQSTIWSGL